jgi:hypothetical protein
MSSTSSIKITKIESKKNASVLSTQQKVSSPKKITLNMPSDDSFDSEIEEDDGDECVIVEANTARNGKSMELKNIYAEQNAALAKETTKYKELAQSKETRIQELDEENFKLREYVITIEEYAFMQKENFERAEKRISEFEALSSKEQYHTNSNDESLNETDACLNDVENLTTVELLKFLDRKIGPFKKFANNLESVLKRISNNNVEETSSIDSPNVSNNRVSTTSKASLKRRQSSLATTRYNRRSSFLSSEENSSTSISEDELTLVTKPISPNTIRLFASNSIKATNETIPDNGVNLEYVSTIETVDTQNLNSYVGPLENGLLGLATVVEEAENFEEEEVLAKEKDKRMCQIVKEKELGENNLRDDDDEEEEEEESEHKGNLDDNIDMEMNEDQINIVDETQEIISEKENVSFEYLNMTFGLLNLLCYIIIWVFKNNAQI